MTEPDFWNDNIAAQKTSQELNELKMKYETFNNMQELSDETELYLENVWKKMIVFKKSWKKRSKNLIRL